MRLLNIYSLELHEFTENAPPPYFILSHRWHGKETSYEDLITGRSVGTTGYQKIEELCAFSIIQSEDADAHVLFGHANIEWVWIDTCTFHSLLRAHIHLRSLTTLKCRLYRQTLKCRAL